jgi:hypothetical protein
MIRVLISDHGNISPYDWWYNYAASVRNGPSNITVDQRIDVLNIELMNWSAQLWQNEPIPHELGTTVSKYRNVYLDFYDEQAYTWFIMRWS